MEIEIWSDVMCPFCYIGKRKFEKALAQFPFRDQLELTWKSFQLAPDMKTDPAKNINQYLAVHKGISIEEAAEMNDYVTEMASGVGLKYDFDKAVVANSFNAHRFSHFAKQAGKQDEAEELLFRAYFTEGKNIDDYPTLVQLGTELGLNAEALKAALESGMYADEVRTDIYEARQVGVGGVPYFLFDGKLAVQGARDSQVFAEALEKSFAAWKTGQTGQQNGVPQGPSCAPGGVCE
ncbi:MAG: DsbA family oxidoreductase [Bacteroidota bacterium]